jgi:hypothetical protein
LVKINCVNPRNDTQHLIFGQIGALTIILHCSSVMVGANTQNDSNTVTSSSASGVSVDWECAAQWQNVSIVTPNDGVIEEQKQKN